MVYSYQDRLDRLGTRKKEVDVQTVTASRTGEASATVDCTIEYFPPEGNEASPHFIQTELIAFTFDTADWPLTGTPQAHDKMTFGGNTYEIVPMSSDDRYFRYTTSSRNRIRFFGRQVA